MYAPKGVFFIVCIGDLWYIEYKNAKDERITHRYRSEGIEEARRLFENKPDGVIKVAVTP